MNLPSEIIEIIIEYLSSECSPGPALCTCALISRVWVIPARRSLWTTFDTNNFQKKRGTFDQLQNLIISPHTTIPHIRTKELVISRDADRLHISPTNSTAMRFLEWCGSLFPAEGGAKGRMTVAKALFGSVVTLRLNGIQIGPDDPEGVAEALARLSNRPTVAKLSTAATFSLLHHFRSVKELSMDDVEFASRTDFWDLCHAFGPTLEKLDVNGLCFRRTESHTLETSDSRTNRATLFPVLRTLELYFSDSDISQLINYCIPSPRLQTLTCHLNDFDHITRPSFELPMRLMGTLLVSASRLRELKFVNTYPLMVKQAEALRKYLNLSDQTPTLTHLTLDLLDNEFCLILPIFPKPHPILESLTIPDLELFEEPVSEFVSQIIQKAPSLKELHFTFTVTFNHWDLGKDSDWYDPDSDPASRIYSGFGDGLVPRKDSHPWKKTQSRFREFAEMFPCDTRKLLRPSFAYYPGRSTSLNVPCTFHSPASYDVCVFYRRCRIVLSIVVGSLVVGANKYPFRL